MTVGVWQHLVAGLILGFHATDWHDRHLKNNVLQKISVTPSHLSPAIPSSKVSTPLIDIAGPWKITAKKKKPIPLPAKVHLPPPRYNEELGKYDAIEGWEWGRGREGGGSYCWTHHHFLEWVWGGVRAPRHTAVAVRRMGRKCRPTSRTDWSWSKYPKTLKGTWINKPSLVVFICLLWGLHIQTHSKARTILVFPCSGFSCKKNKKDKRFNRPEPIGWKKTAKCTFLSFRVEGKYGRVSKCCQFGHSAVMYSCTKT